MKKQFNTLVCRKWRVLFAVLIGYGLLCPAAQAAITLVSSGILPTAGAPSDGNSFSNLFSLSGDGTKMAFSSDATNLVSGDTNGYYDVFVRDLLTGVTTRVSVSSSGTQANDYSTNPCLSADGKKVAFESLATNLVSGDTNGASDVFMHDLTTGVTARVSVNSSGAQGNGYSFNPRLSGDGSKVAFESGAPNLVGGDTNSYFDVFMHDLTTGVTTRVSVKSNGTQGNDSSYNSSLNGNGTMIAFVSKADNLVSGDTNSSDDAFVRDLTTGVITRVSVDSSGMQGQRDSGSPKLSNDGTKVVFISDASNLVSGDTNGFNDAFMHDLTTGVTTRVSVDSSGAQSNVYVFAATLNGDGTKVAFNSQASHRVGGNTNNFSDGLMSNSVPPPPGPSDIFVRDLKTGVTTLINVSRSGAQANDINGSYAPSLNSDGTKVTFFSDASNLVSGDTNGFDDVFVSDAVPLPTMSINNARTFDEGSAAAPGSTTFTVTLSVAHTQPVTVNYQTADGTAKAGSDYVAKSGTLTFAPGETVKYVRVDFIGDSVAEANETFFLDLKTPINATIADSRGSAYIRNDDGPGITIDNAVTIDEGNSGTHPQSFTVHLSAASTQTVTVNWATANGTAGPNDYVAASGTLTFNPGVTSKLIVVQVKGDTTVEPTEDYRVNLSSPTYAVLADSQGVAYIRNDDTSTVLFEDEPSS